MLALVMTDKRMGCVDISNVSTAVIMGWGMHGLTGLLPSFEGLRVTSKPKPTYPTQPIKCVHACMPCVVASTLNTSEQLGLDPSSSYQSACLHATNAETANMMQQYIVMAGWQGIKVPACSQTTTCKQCYQLVQGAGSVDNPSKSTIQGVGSTMLPTTPPDCNMLLTQAS